MCVIQDIDKETVSWQLETFSPQHFLTECMQSCICAALQSEEKSLESVNTVCMDNQHRPTGNLVQTLLPQIWHTGDLLLNIVASWADTCHLATTFANGRSADTTACTFNEKYPVWFGNYSALSSPGDCRGICVQSTAPNMPGNVAMAQKRRIKSDHCWAVAGMSTNALSHWPLSLCNRTDNFLTRPVK